MKRVGLSGATGFLGQNICRELLQLGYQTNIICRDKQKALNLFGNPENLSVTVCKDIFDAERSVLYEYFDNIDVFIHCAWQLDSKMESQTNNIRSLIGTINLAKAMIPHSDKKFIGIGTCAEYQPANTPLSIHAPIGPINQYGACKASAQMILSSMFSQTSISFLWCRVFYLFGEGENENRLHSYIHAKMKYNQPVMLSEGNQIRDYLNVKKAASRILSEINNNKSGVINVCSGIPITIREIAEEIADQYQAKHLLKFGERQLKEFDPFCIIGIP